MHGKAIYMPMLCATKYFVYSAISRANVKNLVVGELLTIRRGVQKDFCDESRPGVFLYSFVFFRRVRS